MSAVVTGLALTPVKATRIAEVDTIELDALGARGNRAFCVIDARDRMVNGKVFAALQTVVCSFDVGGGELTMTFPDGAVVSDVVRYGETQPIRFFSQVCDAQLVTGPWSDALSRFIGAPLRLVAPEVGVDRGREGGVSLISRASVQDLAQVAARDSVDVRRFRMLIEIDGCKPYEEDSWVGRKLRIGPALVAMRGNVGRCLITSRDPDSAKADLPTLDLLAGYRGDVEATEPLPFGIHGQVLEPGVVSVGDPVWLDGDGRPARGR